MRVMCGQWKAKVAALEDEGDLRKNSLDLLSSEDVMTEEVGLGDGIGDGEDLAGDELRHGREEGLS